MLQALKIIIIFGVSQYTAYYLLSRITPYGPNLRRYMLGSMAIFTVFLLSGSTLLAYIVTVVVCYRLTRGTLPSERIALFFGLAFALSYYDGISLDIGLNLGGISYPKVLIAAILIPVFLTSKPDRTIYKLHSIDIAVISFLLWTVALSLRDANLSSIMRSTFWTGIEFLIPYLVIRRHLDNYALVFAALSFSLFSQAMVGAIESVMKWHIYTEIEWITDFHHRVGAMYKFRWGFLRAQASFMNPLIFVLFANMSFLCAVIYFLKIGMDTDSPGSYSKTAAMGAVGLTLLGTLSTVSRSGMLVSAMILVILFGVLWAINSPRDPKNKLLAAAVFFTSIVLIVFEGEIRANFDYRIRLLEIGYRVILDHPILGQASPTEHPAMAELIQGEGIVDLVNHYIAIGLLYGIPGLVLFVYALTASLNQLYYCLRSAKGEMLKIGVLGFTSLLVLAINIFTTSAFAWTWLWLFLLMAITSNIVARAKAESESPRVLQTT